jgi:hypothetical protein
MNTIRSIDHDASHAWHIRLGLECCRACGIVRRADRMHRPCHGPVVVELRGKPWRVYYLAGKQQIFIKDDGEAGFPLVAFATEALAWEAARALTHASRAEIGGDGRWYFAGQEDAARPSRRRRP